MIHQAQVLECDVFLNQPVSADNNVDRAGGHAGDGFGRDVLAGSRQPSSTWIGQSAKRSEKLL